jgi:hypothetical protein
MHGLAGNDIDPLGILSPAAQADFDITVTRAKMHRAVVAGGACVRAVDEHLGIPHLGIELDHASIGAGVVDGAGPLIRSPERSMPPAIIRPADHDYAAVGGRSGDRDQSHQSSSKNPRLFSHFRPPGNLNAVLSPVVNHVYSVS